MRMTIYICRIVFVSRIKLRQTDIADTVDVPLLRGGAI